MKNFIKQTNLINIISMTTDKQLWAKRVMPALNEMYLKAETPFNGVHFNFDELCKYAVVKKDSKENTKGEKQFPYFYFYLSNDDYKSIVKKATKGLRHWWVFPYRSEIVYDDETIESYKKELKNLEKNSFESFEYKILKEKIENNDVFKERMKLRNEFDVKMNDIFERYSNKEITAKEKNKLEKVVAKEYNAIWYSWQEERILFTLADYAPNCNKEFYDKVKNSFDELKGHYFDDGAVEDIIKRNKLDKDYTASIFREMVQFYRNYLNSENVK